MNRLTAYTISRDGMVPGFPLKREYTYEGYNRKTEKTFLEGEVSEQKTYNYDQTNWLTSITGQVSGGDSYAITYAYDNNGNTLSKVDSRAPADRQDYLYSADDRLVRVTRGPPGNEEILGLFDYNHEGNRVRHRLSDRGDVDYFYDDGSVIEEQNAADGSLLAYYVYADRLIALAQPAPKGKQYYHHDALGSTIGLTDAAGNDAKSYRLDPWGNIRAQSGISDNRRIFTGKEHDSKTGLVYFGARFYDPETARFITQDTYLGEPNQPPSLHRYLYAYSNPTVYVDPDGLESVATASAASSARLERGGDWLSAAQTSLWLTFARRIAGKNSEEPEQNATEGAVAEPADEAREAELTVEPADGSSEGQTTLSYTDYQTAKGFGAFKMMMRIGGRLSVMVGLTEEHEYQWEMEAIEEREDRIFKSAAEKDAIGEGEYLVAGLTMGVAIAPLPLPQPGLKPGEQLLYSGSKNAPAPLPVPKPATNTVAEKPVPGLRSVPEVGQESPPTTGKRAWRVGDDVYAPTSRGTEPSWSTVRSRFWRSEAAAGRAAERYGANNLERMARGRAPQRFNAKKGDKESMELSHEPIPAREGGRDFLPRWPEDHARVDPFRRTGY